MTTVLISFYNNFTDIIYQVLQVFSHFMKCVFFILIFYYTEYLLSVVIHILHSCGILYTIVVNQYIVVDNLKLKPHSTLFFKKIVKF